MIKVRSCSRSESRLYHLLDKLSDATASLVMKIVNGVITH